MEPQEPGPGLDRLLAVVSPDERQFLILSYAAGLSATEIAVTVASLAPALHGLAGGLPDVDLSSPVSLAWLAVLGGGVH